MVFTSQQRFHSQDIQRQQQQQQHYRLLPLQGEQEESYSSAFQETHHTNIGVLDHEQGEDHDDNDDNDNDDDENQTTFPAPVAAAMAAAAALVVVVDDQDYSPSTVMHRIQQVTFALVKALDQEQMPIVTSLDATTSNTTATTTASAGVVVKTQFSLHQARSMTSLFLVLSYCFSLLQEGKTTTLREVYYCFVTHFRHQRECCAAIKQATLILGVPRHALGLKASPRGWYCGDIQILKRNDNYSNTSNNDDDAENNADEYQMVMDGRNLQSMHGCPIDASWLVMSQQLVSRTNECNSQDNSDSENEDDDDSSRPLFKLETVAATFILVVEKEGIYNRLSEDRFFDTWPCILVTGKGFPDFSTRALVQTLHTQLQLPVYGLVDCNPYGALILNTYRNHKDPVQKKQLPIYDSSQHEEVSHASRDVNDDVDLKEPLEIQGVPIQWLGFRPSQVEHLKSSLPAAVFQPLTDVDRKRLYALLSINEADILDNDDDNEDESSDSNDNDLVSMSSSVLDQQHPWIRQQNAARRRQELQLMLDNNYKVELEALHWLGMDALSEWLGSILEHEQAKQQQHQKKNQHNSWELDDHDDDDDDDDERDTMAKKGTSWMDIL